MSHLLKSLKQSDAKHREQSVVAPTPRQAKVVHPMRSVKAQHPTQRWLLPLVIALLPAVSIISYKFYQQDDQSIVPQPDNRSSIVEKPVAAAELLAPKPREQAIQQVTPDDVVFMPYPELVTEPLPMGNRQYSSTADYQDSIISNTGLNTVRANSDRDNGMSKQGNSDSQLISSELNNDPYQLDQLDFSGLSPELAAQLKSAISATDSESYQDNRSDRVSNEPEEQPMVDVKSELKHQIIPIGLLPPSIQNQLPKMNFEQHIYSSLPTSRWVKVNGHELHEGDDVVPGVELERIEPREVILKFDGYEISMPALSEW